MSATRETTRRRVPHHQGVDRHCIVLDTDALDWIYHRPLFAGELRPEQLPPMGWMTACGRQMWSGRYGRGPGCMGNRNVIEKIAKPCRRCYPLAEAGGV